MKMTTMIVILLYLIQDRVRAYGDEVFEVDEFAASAEAGRRYGRYVTDLVAPRHRLARLHLLRSRHDLERRGGSAHLLVSVKRRVLCHPAAHTHTHTHTNIHY